MSSVITSSHPQTPLHCTGIHQKWRIVYTEILPATGNSFSHMEVRLDLDVLTRNECLQTCMSASPVCKVAKRNAAEKEAQVEDGLVHLQ